MGYDLKRIQNRISDHGDFKEIHNLDVIKDAVLNLFGVKTRTYVNDPEYGIDISKFIFEQMTQDALDEIRDILEDALAKWVPSVRVQDIKGYKYSSKTLVIETKLKYLHNIFTVTLSTDGTLINVTEG